MRVKTIFLLVSLLCCGFLFGQKENNIWYFGRNAGINFNTTPPTALTNSQMNTTEGCSSVSDANGSLLFYTDGSKVWNKNHDTMQNGTGLKGSASSTQSSVVVKKPGSNYIYYIFTADTYESPSNGVFYNIVDMSQNGGLGRVIQKNTPLLQQRAAEKIAFMKDYTGCNFWIIVHTFSTDEFYSYHFTPLGIDTSAVVSHVGYNYSTMTTNVAGYLKGSPDGKKLAAALYGSRILEMYDFNNTTGILSNRIVVDSITGSKTYYGISFSPDSKILYGYEYVGGSIHQFDVTKTTQSAIQASKTTIASGLSGSGGAMQLGPDGRLYVARLGSSIGGSYYLGVIRYPNTWGTSCGYIDTGIYLSSSSAIQPALGLPNFIDDPQPFALTLSLGPDTSVCNKTSFVLKPVQQLTGSFMWNTGDTGQTITVSQSGIYWMEASTQYCGVSRDSINVTFLVDTAKVNFGPDTTICGSSFTLNAPNVPGASFLWSNGTHGSFINVSANGLYWLKMTTYCAVRGDTIKILFNKDTIPPVNLGKDTALCGHSLLLVADSIPAAKYRWSTGDTTQTIHAGATGAYWVKVSNLCQTKGDTINVTLMSDSVKGLFLGNDTLLCSGKLTLKGKPLPANKYLWSTGDTTANIIINGPGTYWLQQKANCETVRDSITVNYFIDGTSVNLGKDSIVCAADYTLSTAQISANHYLWNTGDTVSSIKVNTTGKYWLRVSNYCNTYSDTINLSFVGAVTPVSLGNDTILCAKSYPLSVNATPGAHILWSTGDTAASSIIANADGTYWVKSYNYCHTVGDTVKVQLVQDPVSSVNLGADTLVCSGTLALDAGSVPKAKYLWNTGDTLQSITATTNGKYSVKITTYVCNTVLADTIDVSFYVPTPLVLPEDTTVCENYFTGYTISSPVHYYKYLWSDGSTKPELKVTETGSYNLMVIDGCGNIFTDTVSLDVCECNLYVPTAFSPNKNGLNDRFSIINSCLLSKFDMKIFTRWGQLIYQSNNPNEGWDGTWDGKHVPEDLYLVTVLYKYRYSSVQPAYRGSVMVVR